MGTIIFLAIFVTILTLCIRIIVKLIQHKSIASILRTVAIVTGCYSVLWIIYYFSGSYKVIPLGTEICFDDWCTTVTKIDSASVLGLGRDPLHSR